MSHTNADLRNHLDKFYPLNDSEFELFSSYFFIKNLKAKQDLVKEGDMEENIYYVVKGILRKYFRREQEEITTAFFAEDEICVSAISYFTRMPSWVIIEAIEPAICIGIKRDDFEFLLTKIPGLEKIYSGVLSTLYVRKDIEQLNKLRFSKRERFLNFCDQQPELLQRVSQKQLASFLEITPETFCRMKKVRYKLAKEARQAIITGTN